MTFLLVYLILFLAVFAISLIPYLLQAIALYKMGKTLGVANPWLSFFPVANVYALGKVAEHYVSPNGKKSAKLGRILLILNIILFILLLAIFVIVFVIIMLDAASDPTVNSFFESEVFASTAVFSVVLPILACYFGILGIAIAIAIITYVAYWKIFSIFDSSNATLYLVLAIFFSFLTPIFLFIVRNNLPTNIAVASENIM